MQVGTAQQLIAGGVVELAVVSGVDLFGLDVILNVQRLLRSAQGAYEAVRVDGMPELLPSFDRLMRPTTGGRTA
ncbi:hypothetical protein [Streptomyces sp. NPDC047079]|uniref:hypothetical protein n=1 Tax=Streptomyces sp. NPDC047079 TaxID=3154607 RepID=UPI003411BAF0